MTWQIFRLWQDKTFNHIHRRHPACVWAMMTLDMASLGGSRRKILENRLVGFESDWEIGQRLTNWAGHSNSDKHWTFLAWYWNLKPMKYLTRWTWWQINFSLNLNAFVQREVFWARYRYKCWAWVQELNYWTDWWGCLCLRLKLISLISWLNIHESFCTFDTFKSS